MEPIENMQENDILIQGVAFNMKMASSLNNYNKYGINAMMMSSTISNMDVVNRSAYIISFAMRPNLRVPKL